MIPNQGYMGKISVAAPTLWSFFHPPIDTPSPCSETTLILLPDVLRSVRFQELIELYVCIKLVTYDVVERVDPVCDVSIRNPW